MSFSCRGSAGTAAPRAQVPLLYHLTPPARTPGGERRCVTNGGAGGGRRQHVVELLETSRSFSLLG